MKRMLTFAITILLAIGMQAQSSADFRPFIEEYKSWRTGIMPAGKVVKQYDYQFYNDTIIGGKTCKVLGRSEIIENHPSPDTLYIGALYEEGRKVYCVYPKTQNFELLYDFASSVGSDIAINGETMMIVRKERSSSNDFKGECTYLKSKESTEEVGTFWMEGVGSLGNPLASLFGIYQTGLMNEILLSCTVYDETIYLRGDTLPTSSEVKKKWLDFTHVVKPRPKSPVRRAAQADEAAEQETLKGEYSARELFVSLKTLTGAYTVTLTDAAGEVVYRKEVQTSNVVALNTDLTQYPDGEYTLTVENAEEQYTALLSLPLVDDGVRDLQDDKSVNRESVNGKFLDLSGRRLNSLPTRKGIYIRDGRKVMVK